MKEGSLVAFTLLAQMAVGAFWSLEVWSWVIGTTMWRADWEISVWVLTAIVLVMGLALAASFFHLGTPARAWRAYLNLGSSWLSREILFASLFVGACIGQACMRWFGPGTEGIGRFLNWAGMLTGLGLLISMIMAYRLRTVPAWHTWTTTVSFATTTLLLGGLGVGVLQVFHRGVIRPQDGEMIRMIALGAVVLISLQLVVVTLWTLRLAKHSDTSRAALARIVRDHGLVFKLRLLLAILGACLLTYWFCGWWEPGAEIVLSSVFLIVLVSEVLGRFLFYQAGERYGV